MTYTKCTNISWDVEGRNLPDVYHHCRGIYCLRLQRRLSHSYIIAFRKTSTGLYHDKSQEMVLCTFT